MQRREFVLAPMGAAALSAEPGKIRAGMIGTGHAHAAAKLKTLQESPDYEVVGVCEPDANLRQTREKDKAYKGVRWVSQDELLRDNTIRMIAAEGFVWENMAVGRAIIAAGKHIHIDKPPGHELAPFRDLVAEARRKKLAIQSGYIWRWHPGINAAFEAARKGWLGDVNMVRCTINTDLDTLVRPDLARYKGGMMFELGGHPVDRIVDLWGRPKAVRPWLRHDLKFSNQLADNTLAVFEYDAGLAVVTTSGKMPGSSQHRSFEVIGSEGTILIQPVEPGTKVRVTMRAAKGPYKAGTQEVTFPPFVRFREDLAVLARAIRSGAPLKHGYDFEVLVHETLLRACGEVGQA
ncbi:MAG: Gfo/Idh/MocA family oxidoreductase [Bryobacteraceae bacterium]